MKVGTIAFAIATAFALTTTLAFAQGTNNAAGDSKAGGAALSNTSGTMDCTDVNMMKVNADMDKMPAGEKKTMGMKEMTMAKDMMGKKDMAACKTHMNKAMEMGMAK